MLEEKEELHLPPGMKPQQACDLRRRLKLFTLTCEELMELLTWPFLDAFSLPIIQGLPKGATIRAVQYDISVQGWSLCVEHESFPIVPLGVRIPDSMTPLVCSQIEFHCNEDGSWRSPVLPRTDLIPTLDGSAYRRA